MALHAGQTMAASVEGDKMVVDGALELAMTAVELYSQPELLDAAKESFREG